MISKEQLEDLRLLEDEAARISNEIQKHRAAIVADVGDEKIDLTLAGVRVYWKAGRKKIDHLAAVNDYGSDLLSNYIDDNTTYPPARIAWAKVTKAAGLDLIPFTTQPAPTLTIEVQ